MIDTIDCGTLFYRSLLFLPVKWNNVLTERVRFVGLEREAEEALYCPQCLPSCNDVQYRISMSLLPIDNYLATLKTDNETELNSDISMLRVYFGEPHAQLYTRLLNNEWFEIFSEYRAVYSRLYSLYIYHTSQAQLATFYRFSWASLW